MNWINHLGEIAVFGARVAGAFFRYGVSREAFIAQVYHVGVRSVGTTVITALFIGAIMALELDLQLRDFGAQSYLGGLATSIDIRNVGPVLIGFILSGKVGAYTSAELAVMQVTDQVNAMRCLGVDPVRYLVVPRMVAVVLVSFLLLVIGLMISVAGGALIASLSLGVNPIQFLSNVPTIVSWWSVSTGVFKSFVFGLLISILCCFHGYQASGGSDAVGVAVRRSAVQSLVAIIVADFALTALSSGIAHLWEVG